MSGFEARQQVAGGFGPTSRTYVGDRKTKNPDKAFAATKKVIDDWHTQRIKMALGREFKVSSRIILKKPRLMPWGIFNYLLRSIIIETARPEERERR